MIPNPMPEIIVVKRKFISAGENLELGTGNDQ
jgi:hypothetical protein